VAALEDSARGLMERTGEAGRVARIGLLCHTCQSTIASYVVALQRSDGGWVDNEDTLWCAALLTRLSDRHDETGSALHWLEDQRSQLGGWGRNPREEARIPLTAIALRFLSLGLATERDRVRLESIWASDIEADLRLGYKGGFFLLAQRQDCYSDLVGQTIEYLHQEANDDGGFGPWRGHPIGSDPWSTGVCLAGLCRFPAHASREVVEGAVRWLMETQLDSGYWPYHFLDEGTAYACWGLSEAGRLLDGA
jgi:prenyltransferase beta subunit